MDRERGPVRHTPMGADSSSPPDKLPVPDSDTRQLKKVDGRLPGLYLDLPEPWPPGGARSKSRRIEPVSSTREPTEQGRAASAEARTEEEPFPMRRAVQPTQSGTRCRPSTKVTSYLQSCGGTLKRKKLEYAKLVFPSSLRCVSRSQQQSTPKAVRGQTRGLVFICGYERNVEHQRLIARYWGVAQFHGRGRFSCRGSRPVECSMTQAKVRFSEHMKYKETQNETLGIVERRYSIVYPVGCCGFPCT